MDCFFALCRQQPQVLAEPISTAAALKQEEQPKLRGNDDLTVTAVCLVSNNFALCTAIRLANDIMAYTSLLAEG